MPGDMPVVGAAATRALGALSKPFAKRLANPVADASLHGPARIARRSGGREDWVYGPAPFLPPPRVMQRAAARDGKQVTNARTPAQWILARRSRKILSLNHAFKKCFHCAENFIGLLRQILLLSMYILYKSYKTSRSIVDVSV